MTTLRERLTEVFVKELKESHENSKEMIASNSTSFDEMGMANTAPGEFAQEEITDRKNLENTGSMANDTDFEGKVSCEDGSECPACDIADKIDDTMDSLASDIIDISVKDDEEITESDEDYDDEENEKVKQAIDLYKKHGMLFLDDKEGRDAFNTLYNAGYTMKKDGHLGHCIELNRLVPFESVNDEEDEDEKRIMAIAHESAKNSLMNILKKKLNEDRFSEEKFVVYLWPFAGYQMIPFEVEASNEEEALEKAVAKAEEEGEADVFADDVEEAENHPDLYVYVDATPYGGGTHYVDAQNLYIKKKNDFGECASKKLKESNGDYAGPRDFVPDTRIHTAAVLETLKNEIGEGSEGIHVDQDLDEDKNKIWIVTQIDKNKLPETLNVMGVKLKKKDGNKYIEQELDKDFPLMK